MANWYPLMLRLEGRTCVIVGGGTIATHKIQSLLDTNAVVIVISQTLHPTLLTLAADHKITVQQIAYTTGLLDLLHPLLVFAATDNPDLNQQIAADAHKVGALVDVVNDHAGRDFMNMATVQRGSVTVAISTGGASPALSAHLQREVESLVGIEYGTLADWMAEARPHIMASISAQPQRAKVWHRVLESSILDTLRQGDEAQARQTFDQIIHEAINNSA